MFIQAKFKLSQWIHYTSRSTFWHFRHFPSGSDGTAAYLCLLKSLELYIVSKNGMEASMSFIFRLFIILNLLNLIGMMAYYRHADYIDRREKLWASLMLYVPKNNGSEKNADVKGPFRFLNGNNKTAVCITWSIVNARVLGLCNERPRLQ